MTNLKTAFSALLVVGLSAALLSQAAFAQGGRFAQNHPRRAEVMGRDHHLGNELRNDKGQLGGNYGNLMAQDRKIQRQEQRDARQNGGFISKNEQHRLNGEENRLNRKIGRDEGQFDQNHPRRSEVMGRDRHLGNELREDKGHLGGNYGNLMAQDRKIQRQEQRDARQNGGFISKNEQNRLNGEENRLNRKIGRDDGNH